MTTPLILKRFKELGTTAYEAKCYLSLLERDSLTVPEVSKIAKIARPNAYEALEKLLAKGFCISRPGKTKRYAAADPSFLKDKICTEINTELDRERDEHVEIFRINLKKKEQEILDKKRTADENIGNLVKELTPIYKNSRSNESPMEYIEIIKDPYQSHKRYMQLTAQAKKEILAFSKPPYCGSRKQREEQMGQQANLCGRGVVKLKSVHEIPNSKEEIQWRLENLIRTTKDNDETRVIKELPMKMAIFDENIVMLPLKDPISTGTSFTIQIIEHPALAKSLKMLFYHVWEQAEDYHVLEDLLKKM